jgi:hypothetical protein
MVVASIGMLLAPHEGVTACAPAGRHKHVVAGLGRWPAALPRYHLRRLRADTHDFREEKGVRVAVDPEDPFDEAEVEEELGMGTMRWALSVFPSCSADQHRLRPR